jgi:hypothetical protein
LTFNGLHGIISQNKEILNAFYDYEELLQGDRLLKFGDDEDRNGDGNVGILFRIDANGSSRRYCHTEMFMFHVSHTLTPVFIQNVGN